MPVRAFERSYCVQDLQDVQELKKLRLRQTYTHSCALGLTAAAAGAPPACKQRECDPCRSKCCLAWSCFFYVEWCGLLWTVVGCRLSLGRARQGEVRQGNDSQQLGQAMSGAGWSFNKCREEDTKPFAQRETVCRKCLCWGYPKAQARMFDLFFFLVVPQLSAVAALCTRSCDLRRALLRPTARLENIMVRGGL